MLKTLHSRFTELVSTQSIRTLNLNEGCKTNLPFNMKEMMVPPECSGEYNWTLTKTNLPFNMKEMMVPSECSGRYLIAWGWVACASRSRFDWFTMGNGRPNIGLSLHMYTQLHGNVSGISLLSDLSKRRRKTNSMTYCEPNVHLL